MRKDKKTALSWLLGDLGINERLRFLCELKRFVGKLMTTVLFALESCSAFYARRSKIEE